MGLPREINILSIRSFLDSLELGNKFSGSSQVVRALEASNQGYLLFRNKEKLAFYDEVFSSPESLKAVRAILLGREDLWVAKNNISTVARAKRVSFGSIYGNLSILRVLIGLQRAYHNWTAANSRKLFPSFDGINQEPALSFLSFHDGVADRKLISSAEVLIRNEKTRLQAVKLINVLSEGLNDKFRILRRDVDLFLVRQLKHVTVMQVLLSYLSSIGGADKDFSYFMSKTAKVNSGSGSGRSRIESAINVFDGLTGSLGFCLSSESAVVSDSNKYAASALYRGNAKRIMLILLNKSSGTR